MRPTLLSPSPLAASLLKSQLKLLPKLWPNRLLLLLTLLPLLPLPTQPLLQLTLLPRTKLRLTANFKRKAVLRGGLFCFEGLPILSPGPLG